MALATSTVSVNVPVTFPPLGHLSHSALAARKPRSLPQLAWNRLKFLPPR